MHIGIGLDQRLRLSFDEQKTLVAEATRLGYQSAWTPHNVTQDGFQICSHWWRTSDEVSQGGIGTGISVVPVPGWSPVNLAVAAGTVAEHSGGKFILGVGSGSIYDENARRQNNWPALKPIGMMREYLTALRTLLDGQPLNHEGTAFTVRGASLSFKPPRVPIYLGALGPQMVRLAGELGDGVALNWSSADQIAWSREQVAEGARRAGRDPAQVNIMQYIRICVDEDADVARRAYTKATLGYAMARPGASLEHGYRGHFGRMGFENSLRELEAMRDRGDSEDAIIEAFPRDLLLKVGYYGTPDGARAAFTRIAEGLDTAIVRVVAARPGVDSVAAVMRACAPGAGN
jgi:alkanesulfonate monooxygenase SsuD/methylene tetrahydromethanopterin reductase-like flavin-dependent oxidoreductase (luciferase family)